MTVMAASVVVGVDGSDATRGAVHWAAEEAWRHGRRLKVVHALGTPRAFGWPGDGDAIVREAAGLAEGWRPALEVDTALVLGSASPVLAEQAKDAAVLVVGSRGLGAIAGIVLGSVSSYLTIHASCPVLVVRHAERWAGPEVPLPRVEPIIVGVDGSAAARRALGMAFEEAAARKSWLLAIQAVPGAEPGGNAETQAILSDLTLWGTKFPDVTVELSVRTGDPASTLSEASRVASMVVLGGLDGRGHPGRQLGSTTQQVLRHAPCPVLVVPV
jgi:nucleotide-binding universal stress UspA family protein